MRGLSCSWFPVFTVEDGKSLDNELEVVDGMQFGEVESLRSISATVVQSIRLYRAYEAQQRYGNGVMGGVIEVTTKK